MNAATADRIFSTTRLQRLAGEWSDIAREPVTVERAGTNLYAFGSELACLRLFYVFRSSSGARVSFHTDRGSWSFHKDA